MNTSLPNENVNEENDSGNFSKYNIYIFNFTHLLFYYLEDNFDIFDSIKADTDINDIIMLSNNMQS